METSITCCAVTKITIRRRVCMIDKEKIKQLTRDFLLAIGENPEREGLKDTPRRVADMFEEMLVCNSSKSFSTTFEADNYDGIVLVKNIDFSSICEHHVMPFVGKAHIAYMPNERILGLSKIGRIIDRNSKKLQLQERLANGIRDDINKLINPKGVAIYIEAKHMCMNIRGITKPDVSTVTTVFSGDFRDFKSQELFMSMIRENNFCGRRKNE